MVMRISVLIALPTLLALLAPTPAAAQYKNSAFGLDVGGWLISKPSVVNSSGELLRADKRPLRLANGLRLGGETNWKMDVDHWWLTFRVSAAFLQYTNSEGTSLENQYDQLARESLGTLFGIQGLMGIRYFFMTDRFRPYMQLSMSYMRMFSFSSSADSSCAVNLVCPGGDNGDNINNFLPHPNVGAFHLQPGVELIISRDVALHIYGDLQHWIIINASDNDAVVIGLGIIFYT